MTMTSTEIAIQMRCSHKGGEGEEEGKGRGVLEIRKGCIAVRP